MISREERRRILDELGSKGYKEMKKEMSQEELKRKQFSLEDLENFLKDIYIEEIKDLMKPASIYHQQSSGSLAEEVLEMRKKDALA